MTQLDQPAEAIARLTTRLSPVTTEQVDLSDAQGRVLADKIATDRPSPASDVSAMDGYALRVSDLAQGRLPIAGSVETGQEPPELPAQSAILVFTGGGIPPGAEAVIKREDVEEGDGHIVIPDSAVLGPGQHVRHRGENVDEGALVVPGGRPIGVTEAAALATFGVVRPLVYRPVRVGILTTGDEVLPPEATPSPWQLRDSNGPALDSLVSSLRWATLISRSSAPDDPEQLQKAFESLAAEADVVILTGGVSMGDYDYIPDVLRAAGAEIIFHRLAQRPGKPMLGAVARDGQAVLALPGNPVSVMVTARRLSLVALRQVAGFAEPDPPPATAVIVKPDDQVVDLWWHRLVAITAPGSASLVPSRGSGDLVSAARSDGFVEIPPGQSGPGPWPYYPWTAS
jgi:molybdopterin molybdotransferase